MSIPGLHVPKVSLHYTNTTFDQSQRHQATPCKISLTVTLSGGLGFFAYIEDFGSFGLHPKCYLHCLNSTFELRICFPLLQVHPVQLVDQVNLPPLLLQTFVGVADGLDKQTLVRLA